MWWGLGFHGDENAWGIHHSTRARYLSMVARSLLNNHHYWHGVKNHVSYIVISVVLDVHNLTSNTNYDSSLNQSQTIIRF